MDKQIQLVTVHETIGLERGSLWDYIELLVRISFIEIWIWI